MESDDDDPTDNKYSSEEEKRNETYESQVTTYQQLPPIIDITTLEQPPLQIQHNFPLQINPESSFSQLQPTIPLIQQQKRNYKRRRNKTFEEQMTPENLKKKHMQFCKIKCWKKKKNMFFI